MTSSTNTPPASTDHSGPNPPKGSSRAASSRSALARLALPVAIGAVALSACNVDIDFDEESVNQTFEVDSFDAISIDAPFEVTIRQGETQSVDVEIGESNFDDLSVEVVDGELRLDLDSGMFSINSDLRADITVTDLEALDVSSASDVVVIGIDVDTLVVHTDAASQFSASGAIDELHLDMSEASSADLDGTTIGTVTLEMSGASSADFPNSVDEISGSIRGASSLDVADETSVRVDTSGASSIDRN